MSSMRKRVNPTVWPLAGLFVLTALAASTRSAREPGEDLRLAPQPVRVMTGACAAEDGPGIRIALHAPGAPTRTLTRTLSVDELMPGVKPGPSQGSPVGPHYLRAAAAISSENTERPGLDLLQPDDPALLGRATSSSWGWLADQVSEADTRTRRTASVPDQGSGEDPLGDLYSSDLDPARAYLPSDGLRRTPFALGTTRSAEPAAAYDAYEGLSAPSQGPWSIGR